jgi:hypothetical protein
MPCVWSLCDISLVSLKNVPLFKTVIPSKIFESMAMGLPILISAPEGEATDIVKKSDSGVIVPPESPKELCRAILRLYNDQTLYASCAKASLVAASNFSRESLAKSFERILQGI